jgi:hypothetical protein
LNTVQDTSLDHVYTRTTLLNCSYFRHLLFLCHDCPPKMPLHVLLWRNAGGQQRRRPSRTLDFKMKHSPLHHQPYKNECTTVKTRRRKPHSTPGHTLSQDDRPDSPQCSLPLPATPRRLILQQSTATKPSRRRASTIISACTS